MQYLLLIYSDEKRWAGMSKDDAAAMAAKIPGARYGSVEVPPIWKFS